MISAVVLEDKIKEIDKPWTPVDVARVNDQVIHLAMIEGEYHWHEHKHEDELFFVYRGEIVIQLRDQEDIILRTGEMAVIPKGMQHCPKSAKPSYILLFEPFSLDTEGD